MFSFVYNLISATVNKKVRIKYIRYGLPSVSTHLSPSTVLNCLQTTCRLDITWEQGNANLPPEAVSPDAFMSEAVLPDAIMSEAVLPSAFTLRLRLFCLMPLCLRLFCPMPLCLKLFHPMLLCMRPFHTMPLCLRPFARCLTV